VGECVQTLRFVLAPRKIKPQQPLGHCLEKKPRIRSSSNRCCSLSRARCRSSQAAC